VLYQRSAQSEVACTAASELMPGIASLQSFPIQDDSDAEENGAAKVNGVEPHAHVHLERALSEHGYKSTAASRCPFLHGVHHAQLPAACADCRPDAIALDVAHLQCCVLAVPCTSRLLFMTIQFMSDLLLFDCTHAHTYCRKLVTLEAACTKQLPSTTLSLQLCVHQLPMENRVCRHCVC
jgi:hypothetical protein